MPMAQHARILIVVLGALLMLPGGCSLIATAPVIGFAVQGLRGESLAAGFFLVGSIAVPLGLVAGLWGAWLMRSGWLGSVAPPATSLLVATGLLLLLPWPGLGVFRATGALPKLGHYDQQFAAVVGVVSPLLAVVGILALSYAWRRSRGSASTDGATGDDPSRKT